MAQDVFIQSDGSVGTVPLPGVQRFNEEIEAVHVPKRLKACLGPHLFMPSANPHEQGQYVRAQYVHASFPKMVYHPKYNSIAEAHPNTYKGDTQAFAEAEAKYKRTQRTRIAKDEDDLDRLLKLGWLETSPQKGVKIAPADSDEI